jgi:hypothetical protein
MQSNNIDRSWRRISSDSYGLVDHGGGFDSELKNYYLNSLGQQTCLVQCEYSIDEVLQGIYPHITFRLSPHKFNLLGSFNQYDQHPQQRFHRFLCSFNGSDHVGRKFLVAALHRWGYFDNDTCSKNFRFTSDKLDGHLADHLDQQQHQFYRKFFIDKTSAEFFESTTGFGHVQYDHARNIHNLECQLTSSFLHVVSETLATSYYPFVTEKFLYSLVTRGLFVAYAQPGWHDHLERYYGFRKYSKIFNYRFDTIQNPVERLVELMSMISKFSVLSTDDWRDLYEMESETVEYNYDHYFSKKYIKKLEQFS